LLDLAGGVAGGKKIQAILLGGAAGTFVTADEIDVPLTFEDTRKIGATLGSGVVLVLDESVDMVAYLRRIAEFFRDESCGQCVPCRVGTVRQEELLARLERRAPLGSETQEAGLLSRYGAEPSRFGSAGPAHAAGERDATHAGHHHAPDGACATTVHQPVKIDNDLYVRDYGKCILCYKCVEACGTDAQNTFAIAVAGRGFDARISTEYAVPLPDSACVYCGNCIGVCPTGALMFSS